jgi:lipoate-protein ligase A
MAQIARRICEAAARGISALGVEARYRPRNDIEVEGKKISGTGGAFEGNCLMYQGTLLLQFDVEKMLRVLRIPAEKLSDKAIASARERVTNLADLLGEVPDLEEVKATLTGAFAKEFGVSFAPGNLAAVELARYQDALAEIDRPDWVNLIDSPAAEMPILQASRKFSRGLLRVSLVFDARAGRIRQVWFSGDFFISPKRVVADLEAALRNALLERVEEIIRSFFAQQQADLLMLMPEDFAAVIRQAAA